MPSRQDALRPPRRPAAITTPDTATTKPRTRPTSESESFTPLAGLAEGSARRGVLLGTSTGADDPVVLGLLDVEPPLSPTVRMVLAGGR